MNGPAASGLGSDKDFHLKATSYGKLNPLVGLKIINSDLTKA
jgi:hypothetical protein